jgi:hypothetical protein
MGLNAVTGTARDRIARKRDVTGTTRDREKRDGGTKG